MINICFTDILLKTFYQQGHVEDPFAFTTFYVSYGLALVMLTLTAFVSDRSPQPEVDEDERRPLLDGHDHVSKSRETTAVGKGRRLMVYHTQTLSEY